MEKGESINISVSIARHQLDDGDDRINISIFILFVSDSDQRANLVISQWS